MQQAPLHIEWPFAQKPANDDQVNFVIGGRGARTEESIQTYGKHFLCKHWSFFVVDFFPLVTRRSDGASPFVHNLPSGKSQRPKKKIINHHQNDFYRKHSIIIIRPHAAQILGKHIQIRKTFRKTCPKCMKKQYGLGRRQFLLKKYKLDSILSRNVRLPNLHCFFILFVDVSLNVFLICIIFTIWGCSLEVLHEPRRFSYPEHPASQPSSLPASQQAIKPASELASQLNSQGSQPPTIWDYLIAVSEHCKSL